jgi:N6-L-threonylcarbamoyladenine synthase
MYKNDSFVTLGIETSCDETGFALYHSKDGLIGQTLFSQIALHTMYGGVIPEIASRTQLEKIVPVFQEVLKKTSFTLENIDVIAVTTKPGLAGSLLIGTCFGKALAWAHKKTLIGINHLEGHIFSSFLEHNVPFPHICLTASGGHTALYYVTDFGQYTLIGKTRDDAAGEAFDKIAKMMDLGYPGGPIIEKYAKSVNFKDFFSYPRAMHDMLDFSFSGLKTAVLYDLMQKNAFDAKTKHFLKNDDEEFIAQVASSFCVAVGDIFVNKIKHALKLYPETKAVTFVGGCACNQYLKSRLQDFTQNQKRELFSPSPAYCTDNGAMIAFVGSYKAKQGYSDSYSLDIL